MTSASGVPITDLPRQISYSQAIESVYGQILDAVEAKLRQRISVLLECDKQLVLFLYKAIQRRIKDPSATEPINIRLISGHRPPAQGEGLGSSGSRLHRMLDELQEAVFSGEANQLLVLPHLDILTTTTQSGLSSETREAATVLYENPDVVFLAFKDPSYELPKVIENLFTYRTSLIGIPRDRLPHLITQREARKLAVERFDPFSLYKYVSGLNAIRCRQILSHFHDRLDYDPNATATAQQIYREIREMTPIGDLEVPQVDLDKEIGGYEDVKHKIKTEILDLLSKMDDLDSPSEIQEIEQIVPKGIIFHGPPGTGKTFFAKAIATSLNATITIVSGPELKSKWVGESEENLRRTFAQARKSAPSIIVFDELDSFAAARGTYTGSGVEHSMVNQLLTEMDGFRSEELVFVVGTTNFVESLDPALLRPGRFELSIHIPYPGKEDRRKIVELYCQKFELQLAEGVLKYLVDKTGGYVDQNRGTRFSGDHLYAIARGLKRDEIRRGGVKRDITQQDVNEAIGGRKTSPVKLQSAEERTIAIHEAGHAVCAYVLPHCPTIETVTIATGEEETLGYVMQAVRDNKYVTTESELLDDICVLLAGRAAERMVLGEISVGAFNDLQRANEICRMMVEELGMSENLGPRTCAAEGFAIVERPTTQRLLSPELAKQVDQEINRILREQAVRAAEHVEQYREQLQQLVERLLADKTVDLKGLETIFAGEQFKKKAQSNG